MIRPNPTLPKPNLPDGMTLAQAQEKLDSLIFHHGIDFGEGLVSKSSAPVDFIRSFAAALFSPVDLVGRSMLDIGAWTGAYSFEAKMRGAKRVLASDHYVWNHPVFRGREAFDFARTLTGLDIETKDIDVPDITRASVGMFDVVLFSGVFYHLLDPIRLTQQISECATHLLIIETYEDALDVSRPAMIYYPGATLNGDASNFWGPNPNCVYEILTEFGFADIWYRKTPGFSDRGVYHAFRDLQSRDAMGWTAGEPWVSLSSEEARAALFAPVSRT